MSLFPDSKGAQVKDSTLVGINGSGNNVNFVGGDKRKRGGIKLLLKYCVPEAIHDSGARGDLGCHPGTREEYIRSITSWGKGEWDSKEKRIFLMTGPAGAGKSAIAHACAEDIEASGNLGASFFFYRPSGWNDPRKFIPTIVYQLTTRYPAYRDIIDAVILDDRLVLQKAMDVQFRELLVKPMRKLKDDPGVEKNMVIIVDGLDECATVDAQIQIIKLVTTSIHKQTTPFSWAFFSRPEPPITSAFSSNVVMNISWRLPLTLSGNADSDIEAYIRSGFETIRAKYNIPPDVPWPTEDDVLLLVSQSAGLFIYPATAIRYIGNGSSGLEERLRSVLKLDSASRENPFSALDRLYILIMMQIPEGILSNTLSLLYIKQHPQSSLSIYGCLLALGLSSTAFYTAISNLYSVLEVTKDTFGMLRLFQFYHRSFNDFLLDETRSKQYFLKSPHVLRHCLTMIVQTLTNVPVTDSTDEDGTHFFALYGIFRTMEDLDGKLEEEDILRQMLQLNWSYGGRPNRCVFSGDMRNFIRKIPKDWRRKIIRPSGKGLLGTLLRILANLNPKQYQAGAYVLGQGGNAGLMTRMGRDTRGWYMRCIP